MDIRSRSGHANILSLGLIAALAIFMLGATILNNINTDKLELALTEAQADFILPSINTNSAVAITHQIYPLVDVMSDSTAKTLRLGTFTTTGYVVDQRVCPPCPAGADCTECAPNAVMVGTTTSSSDLIPFETATPDFFESDILYEFNLVVDNTSGPVSVTDFSILDATASWSTSINNALGFTFKHPEALGINVVTVQLGDTGTNFTGTFTENDFISFGGISNDFSAGRGGTVFDNRGYYLEGSEYYFVFVDAKPLTSYPVRPISTIFADGHTILLLDQDSFYTQIDTDGPSLRNGLGEGNVMALINIPNGSYSGMAFVNRDTETIPQDVFEVILSTFEFN